MTQERMQQQCVGALQSMLRQLATAYPFLPEVEVDGVFGEQTLEAVMLFQREFRLPVTGVVDQNTWGAIRERWQRLAPARRSLRAFPQEGVEVPPGEERRYMAVPQTMFQVLARLFSGIAPDRPDGLHGQASADNVRWLQRAARRADSGVLDWQTWELLCRLYEIFVVSEPELSFAGLSGGRG